MENLVGRMADQFRAIVQSHDSRCGGGWGTCPYRNACARHTHQTVGIVRTFEPCRTGDDCEHFVRKN